MLLACHGVVPQNAGRRRTCRAVVKRSADEGGRLTSCSISILILPLFFALLYLQMNFKEKLMLEKYEAVIGLEVHAQLLTETKLFCSCSTKFGAPPNTNVCPVCLGHPGALPVLNKKAVEYAVLMGLAVNCRINKRSVFARKNYFYPDLPKGYQISQFDEPLCEFGFVEIDSGKEKRKIRIKRIHIEEDAGKLIHDRGGDSLVDLNRSGTPLIEIVSEPDIRTPQEASEYLKTLRKIVTYLEICDGNMEEGSLRCDANISVRLKGSTDLGTRTEIKNMNSFRNVEKALQFEIERQVEILEEGGKVEQETLLWDADNYEARSMRGKEESHDYRYFPEPDLLPLQITDEWITEIKNKMPELPNAKKERFQKDYSLPEYDAEILTSEKPLADYFEKAAEVTTDFKAVSNWVMSEVLKVCNRDKISIEEFPVPPENLGKLVGLISKGTISGKIAKDVFEEMLSTRQTPEEIVKAKNLAQISDSSAIEKAVEKIIADFPAQVEQFKNGKEKVLGFLVGQVMRETKGKANPQMVNKILIEKLRQ